ncbi:RNA-guided endonuclease TnpB family protein, partial [Lactobacillus porci]
NEYPFLKASDSSSFQIVTKNISDAWEAFFAGTRRKPRFHSKHSAKQSYTGKSSGIRIMGKRNMFLPKLRRVRSSKTGVIDGKIKRYTISVDACGRY